MDLEGVCDPVGLQPATAAGLVVAAVVIVSVIAGLVAYRIGFMIAVKRLKAYKKAAPFLHLKNQGGGKGGGRGSSRGGGGGGGGGIRLGFGRLFGGGDDDDGPGASSSMAFTSGTLSSSEMGMSKSMSSSFNASMTASMDQAGSSSDLMSKSGTFLSKSGSMTASGMGSSGVFAGKKKRRQQAARAAADERLKEAMTNGSVEDLKSAIVFGQQEGATPELTEAAAMLADRLIVGFLGFDLMPDEQPYHIRKDLPLAQKMGAVPPPQYDDPTPEPGAMPGQIPSPGAQQKEAMTSPRDEEPKLRGLVDKSGGEQAEDENELTMIIGKDPGHHADFQEAAWIPVPKAGGGVKFYNYVSKKFRETHNEKLSRDVHYKPEARLRVAEEAVVALVEEAAELRAKADAAATQVALLRDELKASTRERWYANHRQRWHNDPATTLHVEWGQLAGISAKYCTEMVNEYTGSQSYLINRMADANDVAQKVCVKLLSSLGLAANVAVTGVLQSQHLTYEASVTNGPTKLLGRALPADKCKLTYLALTGGETVHIPDIKAEERMYFFRGFASVGGAFAAVPIFAPNSGRAMGVLSVDTMYRAPGKVLSTVELEALEVVAASLGTVFETADAAERSSIAKSISATAAAIQNRDINLETMGGAGAAEARTARSIALSCSMQASEQTLRGARSLAAQVEAAVLELEGLEQPSRAVISVSMAMLTVIDYDVVISEMELRQWALPVDFDEQMLLWHSFVLKGMADIAPNLLMAFDHLVPADISVPNCLRFERAEALLASVTLQDVMERDTPMVVQLLYQWLIAAQEVNNLAVVGREAEIAARQFGEAPPTLRPGQVTGDILCDIICKRFA